MQEEALSAIIATLQPSVLQLPDTIVKMIPPRPAGYDFSRELFKKRTGLAFDALAPAETAADMPLAFLFNSERLSRMAQYEVSGGMGVSEMIDKLVAASWKSPKKEGLTKRIQLQTEQILLTYILASSVDDNLSFLARAAVQKSLNDLKNYIEAQTKISTDPLYTGHLLLAKERLKAPEKAKPTIHAAIPPGAPIGCDW